MKKPAMPCPRCGSRQKFGKQKRTVEEKVEIFIRCKKCKWESTLLSGSHDTIYNYRQVQKLRLRAKRDPSLNHVLRKKLRRLNESVDKE